MRAAVVTISDRSFRGERPDAGGPAVKRFLEAAGVDVMESAIVPDDAPAIVSLLIRLSDFDACDLIVTTGGTGLSPRDVTPEATGKVIQRRLPGMEEAIRLESLRRTPYAMLSRGLVGARGRTLIINLPGSPKAVQECFRVVQPVLAHAVALLRDENPYAEADHTCRPRHSSS